MDIENLVKLLKLLKENKTDFVIIGGMALPVHGYTRNTFDLDKARWERWIRED